MNQATLPSYTSSKPHTQAHKPDVSYLVRRGVVDDVHVLDRVRAVAELVQDTHVCMGNLPA
jgi:hypothetical protein